MHLRTPTRHRLCPRRLVHARRASAIWGDGRLTILGTEGYIELRKYIDIAGQPGERPSVPRRPARASQHIDCSDGRPALRPPADRRRAQPHRDRDAAGALLQGDGAGADGAADGRARHGVAAMSKTAQRRGDRRRHRPQSHIIEGYLPNADKFKVVGDLRPRRRADERARRRVRRRAARRRASTSCSRWTTSTSSTSAPRRCVHYPMIMAALARRQARRSARSRSVGSLAEVDEVIAEEKTGQGPADAGLPVPLRQRHPAGQGDHRRRHRRQALSSAPSRRCGAARRDYYAVPWRGKWKTELGGVLMGHAIHPHDMFVYLMGAAQIAVRPRRDAGQPDRGRGLHLGLGRARVRRARLVHRDASARPTRSPASGSPSRT